MSRTTPLKHIDPYGLRGESPDNPWSEEITVCEDDETGRPCSKGRDPVLNAHYQRFLAAFFAYKAAASLRGNEVRDVDVNTSYGFDPQRAYSLSMQGMFAFQDGAWPFIDPWRALGLYNTQEVGLQEARTIGVITRDVELVVASSGSSALFGQGTLLNTGRYLRIGHSSQLIKGAPNLVWFSVRGEWVTRVSQFFGSSARSAHWNLWIVRTF